MTQLTQPQLNQLKADIQADLNGWYTGLLTAQAGSPDKNAIAISLNLPRPVGGGAGQLPATVDETIRGRLLFAALDPDEVSANLSVQQMLYLLGVLGTDEIVDVSVAGPQSIRSALIATVGSLTNSGPAFQALLTRSASHFEDVLATADVIATRNDVARILRDGV